MFAAHRIPELKFVSTFLIQRLMSRAHPGESPHISALQARGRSDLLCGSAQHRVWGGTVFRLPPGRCFHRAWYPRRNSINWINWINLIHKFNNERALLTPKRCHVVCSIAGELPPPLLVPPTHLAPKKIPTSSTLQLASAQGPMRFLGGGGVLMSEVPLYRGCSHSAGYVWIFSPGQTPP